MLLLYVATITGIDLCLPLPKMFEDAEPDFARALLKLNSFRVNPIAMYFDSSGN